MKRVGRAVSNLLYWHLPPFSTVSKCQMSSSDCAHFWLLDSLILLMRWSNHVGQREQVEEGGFLCTNFCLNISTGQYHLDISSETRWRRPSLQLNQEPLFLKLVVIGVNFDGKQFFLGIEVNFLVFWVKCVFPWLNSWTRFPALEVDFLGQKWISWTRFPALEVDFQG